jgi:hypothetical protein
MLGVQFGASGFGFWVLGIGLCLPSLASLRETIDAVSSRYRLII